MIDLSWSHILIVLIVALVVVGPKDLPRLMHTVGRWVAKARGMADQFKRGLDEMSRQADLDELRKEIQALRNERPFAGLEQTFHGPVLPYDAAPEPPAPVMDAAAAPTTPETPHGAVATPEASSE